MAEGGNSEVIKSWLAVLEFKMEGRDARDIILHVDSIGKAVLGMVAALEAASLVMKEALLKISEGLDELHFASVRTGVSVSDMKAYTYAVEQLGGTAEGAKASLESFARSIRNNPGFRQMLKERFGIDNVYDAQTNQLKNVFQAFTSFNTQMGKMPGYLQKNYMQMAGEDERTFFAIINHEWDELFDEMKKKMRAAGLDPDAAARVSEQLMKQWRGFQATLSNIFEMVDQKLAKATSGEVKSITDWLDQNAEHIADVIIAIGKGIMAIGSGLKNAVVDLWTEHKDAILHIRDDIVWIWEHLKLLTGETDNWKLALELLLGYITGTFVVRILASLGMITAFLAANPVVAGLIGAGALAAGALGETAAHPEIAGSGAGGVSPLPEVAEGARTKEGGALKWLGDKWRNRPKWLGGTGGETPAPAPGRQSLSGGSAGDPGLVGLNKEIVGDFLTAEKVTGIKFSVNQGLRTPEEAARNAARGVGVRNSQHLYGAAADLRLYDENGNITRDRAVYKRFADAYEAASRARGGRGRWLGNLSGRWARDIWHFDQGIGYGQTHARNPYTGPDVATAARAPNLLDASKVPLAQRTPFGAYRDIDPNTIKKTPAWFGTLDADAIRKRLEPDSFSRARTPAGGNNFSFGQNVNVQVSGGDRGPATKAFDLAGPRDQSRLGGNTKGAAW